jgi:hypothetical protein
MNAVLRAAESLGLPVDQVLRLDTLFAALVILVFAFAAGIVAGRLSGAPIERWADRRATKGLEGIGARTRRLIAAATASFLLLIAVAVTDLGFYGLLVLAVGLGLSTAILVYQLIRLMTVRAPIALVLAPIAGVVALASTLGGLQPLLTALDGARLGIGASEISLLNLVNALLVVGILWVIDQRRGQSRPVAAGPVPEARDARHHRRRLLRRHRSARHRPDRPGRLLRRLRTCRRLRYAEDARQPHFRAHPADGPFDQARRRDRRRRDLRLGEQDRIPNENLMTETVENWSHTSRNVRLHVPVRVAYDCDIHLARELMLQAAREADRVLESPAPAVWIVSLGENGIDHDIRIWINDAEEGIGSVQSVVLTRILELFREHDIRLPYPQRDVHVKSFPRPTSNERTKSS